ncbi:442_t:CDS:2 [Gigaspora margarita]|uniref:442_t:CDS:1 n=1 Tax=Gigaspora margarita TaxID=4874 RepID=A0ABN7UH61_GIGMA|nr:442_t:CDS:2 [Gigaspora margarita]
MNNKKEDKNKDDLPKLNRENKNSEVVRSKVDVSIDAADMDNEIIDHLFNPGGK